MGLPPQENASGAGVTVTGTITSVAGDIVGRDKIVYHGLDENRVLALINASGILQRAQIDNITQDTILGLARALTSEESMELPQAVREIEHAVGIAREIVKWRKADEKQDDIVNNTLNHVADKIQEGDADGAAILIDTALNISTPLMRNSRATLLDTGLRVSMLRRDAEAAARNFVSYLDARYVSKTDRWSAFGKISRDWIMKGDLEGTILLLHVAGASASLMSATASDHIERLEAATISGLSLMVLGKREGDPERLTLAVGAFRTALSAATETRNAFGIAEQKMHLGQGLLYLSYYLSGPAALDEAEALLREAIKSFSGIQSFSQFWLRVALFIGGNRNAVHQSWARAQNLLGQVAARAALQDQGTEKLRIAEKSFRESLKVFKRNTHPMEWADAQSCLGAVFLMRGQRESRSISLRKAIDFFIEAKKEWTREEMPGRWAMVSSRMAQAWEHIAMRTRDATDLNAAKVAYSAALEVKPPVRNTMEFAADNFNLGKILWKLGAKTSNTSYLEESLTVFDTTLSLFPKETALVGWHQASAMRALPSALIARQRSDLARLEDAIAQLEFALTGMRESGAAEGDIAFFSAQLSENRDAAAHMNGRATPIDSDSHDG